jgi:hypothetical protein
MVSLTATGLSAAPGVVAADVFHYSLPDRESRSLAILTVHLSDLPGGTLKSL